MAVNRAWQGMCRGGGWGVGEWSRTGEEPDREGLTDCYWNSLLSTSIPGLEAPDTCHEGAGYCPCQ